MRCNLAFKFICHVALKFSFFSVSFTKSVKQKEWKKLRNEKKMKSCEKDEKRFSNNGENVDGKKHYLNEKLQSDERKKIPCS